MTLQKNRVARKLLKPSGMATVSSDASQFSSMGMKTNMKIYEEML